MSGRRAAGDRHKEQRTQRMSQGPSNSPERKLLPPGQGLPATPAPSSMPPRQLQEMPRDEMETLAQEFGLIHGDYKTPQQLVAAIHDRRQLIASMDRDAMLDVVKWGRRPVPLNATREQLAQEIVKITSMRFAGLSQAGLVVLARLRGLTVDAGEPVPDLVKKLKKQEGILAKLSRKRRAFLGAMVSKVLGDDYSREYQFLPPPDASRAGGAAPATPPPLSSRQSTIKEEIEEAGLFGGIAGRIKRSADSYLNQKLDEIEARIDRKLDEIDRRLAEWRDKEIANRLRILKVTLWATVIVAALALIYSYVRLYIMGA